MSKEKNRHETDHGKNAEGIWDEVAGTAKDLFGKATDNSELQAEALQQQEEGELKQKAAKGVEDRDNLKAEASARADNVRDEIDNRVQESRESVHAEADEKMSDAISEGRRLKEEAAQEAEELRQRAVDETRRMREEERDHASDAYRRADELDASAQSTVDETVNERRQKETDRD